MPWTCKRCGQINANWRSFCGREDCRSARGKTHSANGRWLVWTAILIWVGIFALALSATASAGQCYSRRQCEAHGWMWHSGGRHHTNSIQAARSGHAGTAREAPRSPAGLVGNKRLDNKPTSEPPGQVDASRPVPEWIGSNPYGDPAWDIFDPNPYGDPSWRRRKSASRR
jgi:hypothetical protein